MPSKKELLQKFLSGIETGDAMAADVVDEDRYIQHNPHTAEGGEGIAALFARISKTNPKVTFVRVFEDGDFAFAHNEYDFAELKIAFEVFRFEGDKAVEHWDNIQPAAGPSPSGRGMTDGATDAGDPSNTEATRALARAFTERVLVQRRFDALGDFVADDLLQHDPELADGSDALRGALESPAGGVPLLRYDRLHRVLAEGDFALCVSEGARRDIHSGVYDLYRVGGRRIVEHWNTIEKIPPRALWKNDNGKF